MITFIYFFKLHDQEDPERNQQDFWMNQWKKTLIN